MALIRPASEGGKMKPGNCVYELMCVQGGGLESPCDSGLYQRSSELIDDYREVDVIDGS